MDPRDVLKKYAVQLLALPVKQAGFIALLDTRNLLPGNLKGRLSAMHLTNEDAAQLFVGEIERTLAISRDSFDKLLSAMKEYKDGDMEKLAGMMERDVKPNPEGIYTYTIIMYL